MVWAETDYFSSAKGRGKKNQTALQYLKYQKQLKQYIVKSSF